MIKQANAPGDLIFLAHTCTLSPSSCSSPLLLFCVRVRSLNIAICCSFCRRQRRRREKEREWEKKLLSWDESTFFPQTLRIFLLPDAHCTLFFWLLQWHMCLCIAYTLLAKCSKYFRQAFVFHRITSGWGKKCKSRKSTTTTAAAAAYERMMQFIS